MNECMGIQCVIGYRSRCRRCFFTAICIHTGASISNKELKEKKKILNTTECVCIISYIHCRIVFIQWYIVYGVRCFSLGVRLQYEYIAIVSSD